MVITIICDGGSHTLSSDSTIVLSGGVLPLLSWKHVALVFDFMVYIYYIYI